MEKLRRQRQQRQQRRRKQKIIKPPRMLKKLLNTLLLKQLLPLLQQSLGPCSKKDARILRCRSPCSPRAEMTTALWTISLLKTATSVIVCSTSNVFPQNSLKLGKKHTRRRLNKYSILWGAAMKLLSPAPSSGTCASTTCFYVHQVTQRLDSGSGLGPYVGASEIGKTETTLA